MKTHRIYSLNDFPIYHVGVLAVVHMLYITAVILNLFYDWKFVSLIPFLQSPPLLPLLSL